MLKLHAPTEILREIVRFVRWVRILPYNAFRPWRTCITPLCKLISAVLPCNPKGIACIVTIDVKCVMDGFFKFLGFVRLCGAIDHSRT